MTAAIELLARALGYVSFLSVAVLLFLLLLVAAVQPVLDAELQRLRDRRAAAQLMRGEGFYIWTPQRRRRRRPA